MQSHESEAIPVSVDREGAATGSVLHKLSGLLILLVDNLFFSATVFTAGLAVPVSCALAFGTSAVGVFLIQKFVARDKTGASLAKALLSGALAGIPTSIAGTVLGGLVLALAGFSRKQAPDGDQDRSSAAEENRDSR